MAYKNTNPPHKSKYLRDPGEKKQSKYIRDKDEGKPKSKYARNPYEQKEHHYNLARHYRDGVRITDEVPEEEIEAAQTAEQTAETENKNVQQTVDIPEEKNAQAEAVQKEALTEEPAVIEEAAPIEETDSIEEKETASETDEITEEEIEAIEPAETEADSAEKAETKGDVTSLFQHSKLSKETTVAKVKDDEDTKRKIIIKTVIVMAIFTAIACALQFATFKIKYYMPTMINIEISLLPEFLISLAYGPVFGLIIIIIKNLFYTLISSATSNVAYASIMSGVVLDTIFVFIGGAFYSKRMFNVRKRNGRNLNGSKKKRQRIFFGGVIATFVTTLISYFLTTYISYPLIIKQFASKGVDNNYILSLYQAALNNLNRALPPYFSGRITEFKGVSQGILFYNMPLTVFKLLLITVLAVIIYPLISPYIHFRRNTK